MIIKTILPDAVLHILDHSWTLQPVRNRLTFPLHSKMYCNEPNILPYLHKLEFESISSFQASGVPEAVPDNPPRTEGRGRRLSGDHHDHRPVDPGRPKRDHPGQALLRAVRLRHHDRR